MEQNDRILKIHDFKQFEGLFSEHHRFLCMIAFSYVNDSALAEDIVQDFFINFWERRNTIQLKGSFRAYASRAVKYSSIDYFRKKESINQHKVELLEGSEYHNPEEEFEEARVKEKKYLHILKLIEKLPPDRRKIFILHAMEQLSYRQIAERQEVSVNTVKTQLLRAYTYIRKESMLISIFICLLISVLISFLKINL
jgi:RNA polymerase sigma-70 factor (ECF subfamily)